MNAKKIPLVLKRLTLSFIALIGIACVYRDAMATCAAGSVIPTSISVATGDSCSVSGDNNPQAVNISSGGALTYTGTTKNLFSLNASTTITNYGSISFTYNSLNALHDEILINSGSTLSLFNGSSINSVASITTGGLYHGTPTPSSVVNNNGGVITNIDNYGAMSTAGVTIKNNAGTISLLTNELSGTITSSDVGTITNNSGAVITTLTNKGAITSSYAGGAVIDNYGAINTLTNSGSIGSVSSPMGSQAAIFNEYGGTIAQITNSGSVSVGTWGLAIYNVGQITTSLVNSSSGSIVAGNNGYGIYNVSTGGIAQLTNAGSIRAGAGGMGIVNTGSIGVLNNLQGAGNLNGPLTFSGSLPSSYNIIINGPTNFGQLSVSGVSGPMAFGIYSGGVDGVAPSTVSASTYADVLQGLTGTLSGSTITGTGFSITNTTGTYSGLNYSLVADTANPGFWNLVFASASSNITGAGTIYQSSNLGSSVNPVFDGGTLQVSSAGTISNNFTVDNNNGVIDQNGVASTFSGVISDAVSGTPGSMTTTNSVSGGLVTLSNDNTYTGTTTVNTGATLALSGTGSIAASSSVVDNGTLDISATTSGATVNAISGSGAVTLGAKSLTVANAAGNLSGVVGGTGGLNITGGTQTLSGANTFSGGVQVQSGAALSIASSNALGSGALALIGSATVPATLNITGTTTIANAITVAGDPVFNITTGTTTTVSSPITDGGVAGDVVVGGGGTLNLTAVNTYTGLTEIGAGSTLALTGSGSITPSVSVTNNGTFNVASKTGNVALGGSFTQTSSGSLVMGFSPASNQRLQIAGAAVLAGSLSLQATGGTYSAGKYTILSANGVSGRFGTFSSLTSNLSSYTRLGYGLAYDANDVYLVFTPNVADTQQSLVNTASVLQGIYTLQNSVLANSFSYDCQEFGANGICVSVGGRNTAVQAASGLNNASGLLIAAYRPHTNYRVGAYVEQNLSVNNAGSTVNLGNNTPLIGFFGAWNERFDGTGAEVKVSAAYGQKNTTVTRAVVGTSEPGSGSSQLNSQGAQVIAKYGFGVADKVIISPYAGIRYTQNNMGGYTEGTSATVTAPLTYSALNTNATTALAGVGASYKVIPSVTTFASAGIETDTNTANGSYSGTNSSISGLTPVNFNANPVRTRPTATLGAYYDVAKNQRLGVTGIYRQEAYQAVQTTTVMATYTVGL